MKNIDSLIKGEINSLLEDECKNLGIPPSFVDGIYGCYSNLERRSFAERVEDENGNTIGARVRLGDEIERSEQCKKDFYHEMWHIREYYLNEETSEWDAKSYAGKRMLEENIGKTKKYLKNIFQKLLQKI